MSSLMVMVKILSGIRMVLGIIARPIAPGLIMRLVVLRSVMAVMRIGGGPALPLSPRVIESPHVFKISIHVEIRPQSLVDRVFHIIFDAFTEV